MSTALALPPEFTIYTAAETRAAWLAALAAPGEGALAVQASAVAEVDAAGVQLLASLARTLEAQQRTLQLVEPSAALASACERLGLSALLSSGEHA
jgi:anti-anti-sigma regulatory factor